MQRSLVSAERGKASDATVIIVGGSGGLSGRYREIVEARGLAMRHFESRVPNGMRRMLGKVAAVIVVVTMVSHALRDQVCNLVSGGAPIIYVRSASISALRAAVAALDLSCATASA